jgi:anti-anti-sigma factor
MAPKRQFTVTSEETDGATVLLCQGRLTMEATESFKNRVKALFAQGKPIVLDMSGVNQMDSSGLGAVVSLWVSAKSASCPLQFYNLSAPVKRLLGTTHVLKAFESCGSHLTKLP